MRRCFLFILICCWSLVFVFAAESTTTTENSNASAKKSRATKIKTTTETERQRVSRVLREQEERLDRFWPLTNITVFHHILNKTIPVQFIYEDDQCVAFYESVAQAPVHFLVIPRKFYRMLSETPDEEEQLLGHLLVVAKRVAKQLGLLRGYRIVINDGDDGFLPLKYLTINVLGGRAMHWPPG